MPIVQIAGVVDNFTNNMKRVQSTQARHSGLGAQPAEQRRPLSRNVLLGKENLLVFSKNYEPRRVVQI